jgi:hypothetical protein
MERGGGAEERANLVGGTRRRRKGEILEEIPVFFNVVSMVCEYSLPSA